MTARPRGAWFHKRRSRAWSARLSNNLKLTGTYRQMQQLWMHVLDEKTVARRKIKDLLGSHWVCPHRCTMPCRAVRLWVPADGGWAGASRLPSPCGLPRTGDCRCTHKRILTASLWRLRVDAMYSTPTDASRLASRRRTCKHATAKQIAVPEMICFPAPGSINRAGDISDRSCNRSRSGRSSS